MCGRFTLTWDEWRRVVDELGVDDHGAAAASYRPRFNIAPTDAHSIVTSEFERRRVRRAHCATFCITSSFGRALRMPDARSGSGARARILPLASLGSQTIFHSVRTKASAAPSICGVISSRSLGSSNTRIGNYTVLKMSKRPFHQVACKHRIVRNEMSKLTMERCHDCDSTKKLA